LAESFFTLPTTVALGASGAICSICGAFGAIVILRRQLLGNAAGLIIGQWLFWLLLNLAFSYSYPGIAIQDHIGGLVSGFVRGALLIPCIYSRSRT
jgi:membrane associated rhomboid family serine protease